MNTKLWKYYQGLATVRVVRGPRDLVWPPSFLAQLIWGTARAVGFSPNGELLASGSESGEIRLWYTETGAQLCEPLSSHAGTGAVDSIHFSADGKTIAAATSDGLFQLWNLESSTIIGSPVDIGVGKLDGPTAFSPDGQILAFGSSDGSLKLWDVAKRTLSGSHPTGSIHPVTSLTFSTDGMALATGSEDGPIQLWDPKTGKLVGEPFVGHTRSVHSLAFSPDGRILASGSGDRTIRIWDPVSGRSLGISPLEHDSWVRAIAFSSDGSILASTSGTSILLWDASEWKRRGKPLTGHIYRIHSFAWSPRSCILVSASPDAVRSWNIEVDSTDDHPPHPHATDDSNSSRLDGEILESQSAHAMDPHESNPSTEAEPGNWLGIDSSNVVVAFSPDGRAIASACSNEPIRLWDSKTGASIGKPLVGHTKTVICIAFSPDGRSLASGSHDKTVRSWIAETCAPLCEPMTGHTEMVWSVTYSPDGTILASTSIDESIRLWDARSGVALGGPLSSPSGRVAISPDNKVLVSIFRENTLRSWQVGTGSPISETSIGDYSINSIAFSPEGMLMVTFDTGTISVWDPFKLQKRPNSNDVEYPGYKSCLASAMVLLLNSPWVECFSDRLLWLPSEYHHGICSSSVAISHGIISFVSLNGVFGILDVSRVLDL